MIKENEQCTYLNVLKILASIAVVFVHISGLNWSNVSSTSFEWNVMNFFDSISRWCNAIFMMITGALLLDENKELTVKKIYTKYIMRIIKVLFIWSTIFALYQFIMSNNKFTISKFIEAIINGDMYHLWYLYMLIGFYLITPIVRQITKNKEITKYYLIIWIVFCLILNPIFNLPGINRYMVAFNNLNLNFLLNNVGYFILGHYLNSLKFNKKTLLVLNILSFISFIFIILVTRYFKIYNMELSELFYNWLSLPVFFNSAAIFCTVKEIISNKNLNVKFNIIINKWTKLTLGIYLIHPLFISLIIYYGYDMLYNFNLLTIPHITIVIYLFSFICTFIISKIPIIKKCIE